MNERQPQPATITEGGTVEIQTGQSGVEAIVDAGVAVVTVTASLSVGTSTGIWATWASVAIRDEDAAHRARAELARVHSSGGDWGQASTAELEASLVAISASAFAIDGFYGSIRPWSRISEELINRWKKNGLGRSRQIFEVFKLAFVLGSATNRWPNQLKWLFNLRDDNIHFDEDFRPPVAHPVIGNTSHERMTYAVENAEKAVDLLLEVLTRLVDHPKPTADPQLVDFAQRWKANVHAIAHRRDELKQLRAQ